MSQFMVNSAGLRAAAEELSSQNSQLKSYVESLSETEMTLNGMWEGDAKNAFHTAFSSDKGQMDNFCAAVDNYVVVLNNIAVKYEQAEARNAEIASTRTYG